MTSSAIHGILNLSTGASLRFCLRSQELYSLSYASSFLLFVLNYIIQSVNLSSSLQYVLGFLTMEYYRYIVISSKKLNENVRIFSFHKFVSFFPDLVIQKDFSNSCRSNNIHSSSHYTSYWFSTSLQ